MSCTKSSLTLKVVAGDILSRTLTFRHDDQTPYDLSIYTEIKMEVRKNGGEDVVASGSLTGGQFVISGEYNNILDVNIQMPPLVGAYKYDIEFSAFGIKETLVRGQINLLEQITE